MIMLINKEKEGAQSQKNANTYDREIAKINENFIRVLK